MSAQLATQHTAVYAAYSAATGTAAHDVLRTVGTRQAATTARLWHTKTAQGFLLLDDSTITSNTHEGHHTLVFDLHVNAAYCQRAHLAIAVCSRTARHGIEPHGSEEYSMVDKPGVQV